MTMYHGTFSSSLGLRLTRISLHAVNGSEASLCDPSAMTGGAVAWDVLSASAVSTSCACESAGSHGGMWLRLKHASPAVLVSSDHA